jgi:hypothetical protein
MRAVISAFAVVVLSVGLVAAAPQPASAAGDPVVSGVVRDANGSPLSGVNLAWYGDSDPVAATTAADGSYSASMPAGSYVLSISWYPTGDCCFSIGTVVDSFTIAADKTLDMTMPAMVTATVKVVDSAAQPVQGTDVHIDTDAGDLVAGTLSDGTPVEFQATSYSSQYGQTNANGRFSFQALKGDVLTVHAYPPGSFSTTADIDTGHQTLVTVVVGGNTVSGVVRDSTGVAQAGVDLQWFADSGESVAVTTAADGSYSLKMPTGVYALAMSWYPGSCCFAISTLVGSLDIEHDKTLSVTMPPTATVRVSVVDPAAQPVSGANVQLDYGGQAQIDGTLSDGTPVQFEASGYDSESGQTNANGRFSFLAMKGDGVTAHIAPQDSFSVDKDIVVTSNPTAVTVSTGHVLSGVVRNAGGSPLAGVVLDWFNDLGESVAVTTAADGSYAVGVPDGSYTVAVNWFPAGDCCFAVNTVAGAFDVTHDKTLNMTMPAVAAVHVTVTDHAAQPVPGADVLFDSSGLESVNGTLSDGTPVVFQTTGYDYQNGQTDDNGQYQFLALKDDTVPTHVLPPGQFSVSTYINVPTNPTSVTIVTGGSTVSGVVRDAGGSPVAGIDLQWFSDSESVTVTTGADGSYSISMPTGQYSIGAQWFPLGSCCWTVDSFAGPFTVDGDKTLNMTMPAVVTVNMSAVNPDLLPVVGADVQLDTDGQSVDGTLSDGTPVQFSAIGYDYQSGQTDANGNFSFNAIRGDQVTANIYPAPPGLNTATTIAVNSDPTNVTVGVPDRNRAIVTSAGSQPGLVTVTAPDAATLLDTAANKLPYSKVATGGLVLTGEIDYRVTDIDPGASLDLVLQLPSGSSPTSVYELQKQTDGRLVDVSSIATIAGDQVTLHLTDGGFGDVDGSVDSEIAGAIIPVRAVAPDRPSNVRPIPGSGSATLSWTAPANNGSPINDYRVTPYLDGVEQPTITIGSTHTTQTITGLVDGSTYYFKVAAHNANGWGLLSPGANPVTVGTPLTPTGLISFAGNAAATLAWTAPADDNGSPVTGYVVTPFANGVAKPAELVPGTVTAQTFAGLPNGATYTFKIAAVNANGTGPSTIQLAPVVVGSPGRASGVFSSPRYYAAQLHWTAPVDNGSIISGYIVTPYANGVAQYKRYFYGKSTTAMVTGLTNGVRYTFTVAAFNGRGTGAATFKVAPVIAGTPGLPTQLVATAGAGSATLTWVAPANDNGSVVIGYAVTPFIDGDPQAPRFFKSTATTQTITGLTPGVSYSFRIAAFNQYGSGAQTFRTSPVDVT